MVTMPERRPEDGPIAVIRTDDDTLEIAVTTSGVRQSMRVGDFNAWRLFGTLALVLMIPLPAAIGKAIKW